MKDRLKTIFGKGWEGKKSGDPLPDPRDLSLEEELSSESDITVDQSIDEEIFMQQHHLPKHFVDGDTFVVTPSNSVLDDVIKSFQIDFGDSFIMDTFACRIFFNKYGFKQGLMFIIGDKEK